MNWIITNCTFTLNQEISRFRNAEIELLIDKEVAIWPDVNAVNGFLMKTHRTHILDSCQMESHDSPILHVTEKDLILTLGYLQISFPDNFPCPILSWAGESNESFNLLTRTFKRYTDLKAFW